MQRVPVLHKDGTPLMPCKPAKARKLILLHKAVKRWTREGLPVRGTQAGVFYIQLTFETSKHIQPMCLGIDPGTKFDGYAVVTEKEIVTSGLPAARRRRQAWQYYQTLERK
jgi:hypothetical protein